MTNISRPWLQALQALARRDPQLADDARAAGASEAEITEAVEVAYPYGGTAALVMGVNAFASS